MPPAGTSKSRDGFLPSVTGFGPSSNRMLPPTRPMRQTTGGSNMAKGGGVRGGFQPMTSMPQPQLQLQGPRPKLHIPHLPAIGPNSAG